MRRILIVLVAVLLMQACSKDRTKADPGAVMVRVINNTSSSMTDVHVADAVYGNLLPTAKTEYKTVATPIYAGICSFTAGGVTTTAGYGICGTPPMPPPLAAGYYTFRIRSSSVAGQYELELERD